MKYRYNIETITNKRGDIVELDKNQERTRQLLVSGIISEYQEPKPEAEKRTRKGGRKLKDASIYSEEK